MEQLEDVEKMEKDAQLDQSKQHVQQLEAQLQSIQENSEKGH